MKHGVVLIVLFLAACASPATTRETGPRSEVSEPRFAAGGPDADEYGAAVESSGK